MDSSSRSGCRVGRSSDIIRGLAVKFGADVYEVKKRSTSTRDSGLTACRLPNWCEFLPEGLRLLSCDEDLLKKRRRVLVAGQDYATIIMISTLASLGDNHWA